MTNQECEQIRIAAAAREDGETAPLSGEEIDAHVNTCAACGEALASLADLRSRFHGARRVGDEQAVDVVPSVRKNLAKDVARVVPMRHGPYWTGAIAISLVLLLAVIARPLWQAAFQGKSSATPSATAPHHAQPSADASSAPQPSSTPPPPSATQAVAALTVSIDPELFDEPSGNRGGRAPFDEESHAEEFALGVVEEVVERGKSKFLPLKLTKVFLGRLPTGTFLAEDKMVVRIECSLPQIDLGTRSQLYKVGSKVVVYLSRDEAKRWQVTSIVPILPGQEEYWHKRLQSFADVMLAPKSDDPEKRFRELLVPQPNGGLESTLYYALGRHPHPAARPAVRELWRERVKKHPVDLDETNMLGAMSLVYLMRSLGESEMLDEVLEHALRQKPGNRGTYIWELRIQAEYADAAARRRLKAGLQKFLDDLPPPETLDPVKDAMILADITMTKQSLQHLETLEPKPKGP